MNVLGIESTAHTIGIGIVSHHGGSVSKKNTKVIANSFDRFASSRNGFIPRQLAEHHAKKFKSVLENALEEANISLREINAVAYSQGPGLGHCLHVGFAAANSLSLLADKKIVPVNHTVAHVVVGNWSCGTTDPLVIYVSGGNTQIAALEGKKPNRHYRVFGETLDVGIGNFLDNVGRELSLSPPDAVGVMKNAAQWKSDELFELPYTVKGMDLAFSGLLTAVKKLAKEKKEKLCYSVQETAFAMLVEAAERCLCHTRKKKVLIVGGVAQNARLQQMLSLMCREQGARFAVVPSQYAGDNGAMIALTGLQMLLTAKNFGGAAPNQNLRIDRTRITW